MGNDPMRLEDALYNWLQIKIVADARQDDGAARETLDFFEQILREDHQLTSFKAERSDETMIYVRYEKDGKSKTQMFDRESAEQLLADIESSPD
jgi:hypothetical protein